MGSNEHLAGLFGRMAQMLELLGEDRFRAIAHDRVARIIADSGRDFLSLADDRDALIAIDGIGEKTADKIIEYAETERIKEHDQLAKKIPAGLMALLDIPGLGPKTVRTLWKDGHVESLADLKRIIDDGSILGLPRMGKKTVDNLKESIAFSEASGGRTPLGIAMPIAEALVEHLGSVRGVERIAYAGSLRRGRDTIGDIDLLAVAKDEAALRDAFTAMEGVEKVLAMGEKKCSVRLACAERGGGGGARGGAAVQVDLRIIPLASWGAAMMYFTGSKEHNIRLRERSQKRGLTLNEYGLYPDEEGEDSPPQERGVKPVAGKTEHDIYEALDLAWAPPELREDRGEVADGYAPPPLVTIEDIKAELHAHTTASDGKLSIEELALAAKARGFHTIAVTDHSKSSAVAGGLSAQRLLEHADAVREADRAIKGIRILAGSEVDILADGSLDYDDEILAALDIVVASPHASLRQDRKAAMKRLLNAVCHPLVHILGHPTGRLIGEREGFDLNITELAHAAAEHGVALELNANWRRLDLRDAHVSAALEAGALIAINCDVHREAGFDNLRYGVLTARRGGLTPDRCISTWSARKLHAWLASKR